MNPHLVAATLLRELKAAVSPVETIVAPYFTLACFLCNA
jgi:hypothetical protein